jgi:hypothetical protein
MSDLRRTRASRALLIIRKRHNTFVELNNYFSVLSDENYILLGSFLRNAQWNTFKIQLYQESKQMARLRHFKQYRCDEQILRQQPDQVAS